MKLIRSIRETPAKALSLLPAIWCIAMLRAEEWPEPESNSFDGRNGIGWNAIGVHEVIGPESAVFSAKNGHSVPSWASLHCER